MGIKWSPILQANEVHIILWVLSESMKIIKIKNCLKFRNSLIWSTVGSCSTSIFMIVAKMLGISSLFGLPSNPSSSSCSTWNLVLVWLPNNQSSSITHRMLKVHVNIQGVDTKVDFKVWNEARYEVILNMVWLKHVDAWIACKEGTIHEKLYSIKCFYGVFGGISLGWCGTLSSAIPWPSLNATKPFF